MVQRDFQGKHSELTESILSVFYRVYRILGYGFNESVYENSLAIELVKLGFKIDQQYGIEVFYEGRKVGVYFADLIVNDVVIIEMKAVKQLVDEHEAQLLNYLKATRIEVGLLLNFGPRPEVRRRVYDNERKGSFLWLEAINPEKLDTDDTEYTDKNKER
jgi:GxxExxY protein